MARKTKSKIVPANASIKNKENRTSKHRADTSSDRNVRRKVAEKPWKDGELIPQFTRGQRSDENIEPENDGAAEQKGSPPVGRYHARKPGEKRTPPPDVPSSIDPKTHLAPPEADDPFIRSKYEVEAIAITNNTVIQHAVTRLLTALKPLPEQVKGQPQPKPVLVAVMARAAFANKCISVAELSKRKLNVRDQKWFQYTGFWSRTETFDPPRPSTKHLGINVPLDSSGIPTAKIHGPLNEDMARNEEQEEAAFEGPVRLDRRRIRQIPCLVIYLSRTPIARLKDLYSEQRSTRIPKHST